MNKLIVCVGISGSGKSTWSTDYIKNNPNTLRVNRDDIRRCLVGDLSGYYQRKDINFIETRVTSIQITIMSGLFVNRYNVISDNTNLRLSYFKELKDWFSNKDVKFKLFDCDLKEAKERVVDRDCLYVLGEYGNTEKYTEYIDKQYQQYQEIKKYIQTNYKDQVL